SAPLARDAVAHLRAQPSRRWLRRLGPDWSTSRAQLAALYARVGLWYAAAGHYNQALRLNRRLVASLGPAAAAADTRAAAKQLADGKAKEARRLLEQAVRYQPNDFTARQYLAVVHADNGAWEKAQAQLQALQQSLPDDALLRDNLQRARDHQP